MRHSLLPLILLALVGPATAQSGGTGAPQWTEKDQGWHFYEPPPPPRPKPLRAEVEPIAGVPAAPQVPPLGAAWIRENLQNYMDRALDDPSPENVETWMLLQRLAMDKSQRFSEMTQQVVALTPALDERKGMGGSTAEREVSRSVADEARKDILASLSDRIGIWYFFKSDCPFCMRQDPSLQRLTNETGIQILPISIDGPPLASGAFPDYVVDGGQAKSLGVQRTPTLVVSSPTDNDLTVLFDGLAMLTEIETRLIEVAFAKNWITREQFDIATRGDASNFLDVTSVKPRKKTLQEVVNDPDALLEHLRQVAAQGAAASTELR